MIGTSTPTVRRRVSPYSSTIGVVTMRASLSAASRPSDSFVFVSPDNVCSPFSTGASKGSCCDPKSSAEISSPRVRRPLGVKRSSNRVQPVVTRTRSIPLGTGAASSVCVSEICAHNAGGAVDRSDTAAARRQQQRRAAVPSGKCDVGTSGCMGRKVIIGAQDHQLHPHDIVTHAALPNVPWQLTGNHWLALPCIHPADGSIYAVGMLHRGARAAVEFAGSAGFVNGDGPPLLKPVIEIDGVVQDLSAGTMA